MKTSKITSLVVLALAFSANAETVSLDTAKLAAGSWALSDAALGVSHGRTVGGATAYDVDGAPGFYAVSLEGGGTLFLAADDEIGPVLAFTSESAPDLSEGSPLRDLLERDIKARRGVAAGEKELDGATSAQGAPTGAARTSRSAGAKAVWSALTASAGKASGLDRASGGSSDAAGSAATPQETLAVSDIRVEPLVKSQWSQQTAGGGNCYNYYTPNNYPCGCVATAAAQIMRYWKWPAGVELEHYSNVCSVGTGSQTLYTVGHPDGPYAEAGDRVYDWESMKLIPKSSATLAERQAIGRLTSDIGVALVADYTSSGTGASSIDVSKVFRDKFSYPSGVEYWNDDWESALQDGGGLHSREARNKVIYACLDARLPVQLSIADGNGYNGHAVVCDGYGFVTIGEVETEFAHINMGWAGTGDMWYNIPDIDSTAGSTAGGGGVHFQIIKGATFNVSSEAFGELLTGRITDDGEPVAEATVTAYEAGTENAVAQCTTDEHGIYAFKLPANASYDVTAVSADGVKSGMLGASVDIGETRADSAYVVYSLGNVGNSWGNDIDITIPHVRIAGGDLYPNLNAALAAASTMENPVIEIFGPTRLRSPVTVTTNVTIRTVPQPSADYPDPTLDDCVVLIETEAVDSVHGWAFQVADGARVDFSNIVFRAESGALPVLDVLETGKASFAGLVCVGTVATRTEDAFVLAGAIEPTGDGLSVSYPGATGILSPFGVYECSDDDAEACARLIVDALDPTLAGAKGASGTLVWDRVEIDPSIAVAYATNAERGTRYYLSMDLLFEDYADGAEVVFLKDCPAGMFTNGVVVSASTTVRSGGDGPVLVTAGSGVGFTVQGEGTELVFSNVAFTRSAPSATSLVTVKDGASFTLADGAAIAGLKLSGPASAVYVEKGLVTMQDGSAITNCTATSGATGKAAGVYLKGADCTFDFAGGLITGCKATPSDGGAVYADKSATVYVSGSATAYGNTANKGKSVRNVYAYSYESLVLSNGLTGGEIGVYCSGGTADGKPFAVVGDGVSPDLVSGHFSNDYNAKCTAAPSGDGATLVWVADAPGPKTVPEAEAEARLVVGSSSATYATVGDAFEAAGQSDARIELLRDASLSNSLYIASEKVLDGMGFTLTRAGDFFISAASQGAVFSVTNIVLDGGIGWCRFLDVANGGALRLESGTVIEYVFGFDSSMVAPVVVWDGSIVMESGVEIRDCFNDYESPSGGSLTAGAIVVSGSGALADFRGGKITNCTGARAGGVTIANGAGLRVAGDLTIDGNSLLSSGDPANLVVHDKSSLVLAGLLTGRVGYTEGVHGDTNVFGTVDADFLASTTASNVVVSARRFTHDATSAKGMVATNETEAVLVWSSAVGDATEFTNVVAGVTNVYDVVVVEVDDDPEIVECAPFAFAAIEEVSPGTWKLTLKPGTEHCVYTLKCSDDLETWTAVGVPRTLSAEDISGEGLEFFFEVDDSDGKKYWKVEGANGIN